MLIRVLPRGAGRAQVMDPARHAVTTDGARGAPGLARMLKSGRT
ncbi:hypothetical protein ACFPN0_32805 [Kitasatospora cinereorecta]